MIVVVDTNVLISALMKDSVKRRLILLSGDELVCPEAVIHEIRKHRGGIITRSGLDNNGFDSVLEKLLESVALIPDKETEEHRTESMKLMKGIDIGDAPFIAAALGIPGSVIWSDDKDLKRQKKIKIMNTKDFLGRFLTSE
jgi:predicted nucleic acid-binding protein